VYYPTGFGVVSGFIIRLTLGITHQASRRTKSCLQGLHLATQIFNLRDRITLVLRVNNLEGLLGCPRLHHLPFSSSRGAPFPKEIPACKWIFGVGRAITLIHIELESDTNMAEYVLCH